MTDANELTHIDIVLTRGPGPDSDFVEVEDARFASINIGEWMEDQAGNWRLRIPDPRRIADLEVQVASLLAIIPEEKRGTVVLIDPAKEIADLDAANAKLTEEKADAYRRMDDAGNDALTANREVAKLTAERDKWRNTALAEAETHGKLAKPLLEAQAEVVTLRVKLDEAIRKNAPLKDAFKAQTKFNQQWVEKTEAEVEKLRTLVVQTAALAQRGAWRNAATLALAKCAQAALDAGEDST